MCRTTSRVLKTPSQLKHDHSRRRVTVEVLAEVLLLVVVLAVLVLLVAVVVEVVCVASSRPASLPSTLRHGGTSRRTT